jgi:hypothetical protein
MARRAWGRAGELPWLGSTTPSRLQPEWRRLWRLEELSKGVRVGSSAAESAIGARLERDGQRAATGSRPRLSLDNLNAVFESW